MDVIRLIFMLYLYLKGWFRGQTDAPLDRPCTCYDALSCCDTGNDRFWYKMQTGHDMPPKVDDGLEWGPMLIPTVTGFEVDKESCSAKRQLIIGWSDGVIETERVPKDKNE